ncbi:LysM peptidoglycan-binding domain-containing protein [uncultured Nonlabens sp.]|uniref:LysM peptidoglycan-binding domain-containing protein n=1 Tax=uncultured Nonlabens sp. TaxID=859306 RepID=UPI00260F7BA7|nr:LysM peptidoglycan-binding domain-containing protein [uncultured Nonlabens sp.]
MIKQLLFLWLGILALPVIAQNVEDLQINPLLIDRSFQEIKNPLVLNDFFKKVEELENGTRSQVTVVQIGDSHVQGPYFPQFIRQGLQNKLGNAGRGFVFPYRVAGTNGAIDVKFKANGDWTAVRNVKSKGNDNVGLSGINLETTDSNFIMEVDLDKSIETVTEVTIASPHPERFKLSTSDQSNLIKRVTNTKTYKVKPGDYLGKIAAKFHTSVKKIQRANGMKNVNLRAGQSLKIPGTTSTNKVSANTNFKDLTSIDGITYQIPAGTQQLYLRAARKESKYVLDGLLLSTGKSGVHFHGIGVNGTKFSDYNKFPRFFDQLAAINPDLIIISLGANESFYDTYTEEKLKSDMDIFNREMIKRGMTGSVLLTSPPPSMKKRKRINSTATVYAYEMGVFANLNSWAFYDLHSVSRTSTAMPDWYAAKLTSSDRIHFIKPGYQLQAQLLVESIFNSYDRYKK